mmetsp:Transcript_15048/g.26763  ORF Transcript_15048/g.26763 Transcript_15048/m.26763 type:complete len:220 (+) Transcript_15048:232-891(+)
MSTVEEICSSTSGARSASVASGSAAAAGGSSGAAGTAAGCSSGFSSAGADAGAGAGAGSASAAGCCSCSEASGAAATGAAAASCVAPLGALLAAAWAPPAKPSPRESIVSKSDKPVAPPAYPPPAPALLRSGLCAFSRWASTVFTSPSLTSVSLSSARDHMGPKTPWNRWPTCCALSCSCWARSCNCWARSCTWRLSSLGEVSSPGTGFLISPTFSFTR